MAHSLSEKRTLLAKNILFCKLTENELNKLLKLSTESSYTKGQLIFQKGDAGDSLLAVLEGEVSISANSEDGKEIILNTIPQGEMFGEIACIDSVERSATATAVSHCTLLAINRNDFIPFLKTNPEIAIELLKALCLKLRDTSNRVETVGLLPVHIKLARFLLNASEKSGQKKANGLLLDWKKSQQVIGNEIGTSRESVNRLLNQWKKQKILLLGGQSLSITIIDIDALEAIAN
ncbi:MAG: Crp/Fnr family transcriptional regulator [Methylococcaceae bacterium]|nr:Crp/Fnr family transcriptional regulator [Methylococcaceae bacterium]